MSAAHPPPNIHHCYHADHGSRCTVPLWDAVWDDALALTASDPQPDTAQATHLPTLALVTALLETSLVPPSKAPSAVCALAPAPLLSPCCVAWALPLIGHWLAAVDARLLEPPLDAHQITQWALNGCAQGT